jgi:hypothetical protein
LGSDSDGEKQKVILTRAMAIIEKDILEVQQIIEDNKIITKLIILKKEKIDSLKDSQDEKKQK